MANGHCSECGGHLTLGKKPRIGQITRCQLCGERMIVVNLSPIELGWICDDDTGGLFRYGSDFNFDFGLKKYKE